VQHTRHGKRIRYAAVANRSYDLWLGPGMRDGALVCEMLKPYAARLMRRYPVSTRINHVANDDEGCSAPVELAEVQTTTHLINGLTQCCSRSCHFLSR
jgi:hypothetical protein